MSIYKNIKLLFIASITFFSISHASKANYNPVETLNEVDEYFYENRYGGSIFSRIIMDYFYLVMDEKKKSINKSLIEKIHYDHAFEFLELLGKKNRLTGKSVSKNISYREMDEINYIVMLHNKIPQEAWVLGEVFSVLDENKKEYYWQDILDAKGNRSQEIVVVYSLMKEILEKEKAASAKQKVVIKKWIERMRKILSYNKVSIPD